MALDLISMNGVTGELPNYRDWVDIAKMSLGDIARNTYPARHFKQHFAIPLVGGSRFN